MWPWAMPLAGFGFVGNSPWRLGGGRTGACGAGSPWIPAAGHGASGPVAPGRQARHAPAVERMSGGLAGAGIFLPLVCPSVQRFVLSPSPYFYSIFPLPTVPSTDLPTPNNLPPSLLPFIPLRCFIPPSGTLVRTSGVICSRVCCSASSGVHIGRVT
jgi:hypothetical protein